MKRGHGSDSTSNASGTLVGSKSSFGGRRGKSLLLQKIKQTPRTVKLDPTECIIQATFQLPYRLVSN